MRQVKTVEVKICDTCKTRECFHACPVCGADICSHCQEKVAVYYAHGVNTCGEGDAYVCFDCNLTDHGPLLLAYRRIAYLRRERDAYSENFQKRAKGAEITLEKLLESIKQKSRGGA